MKLIVIATLGVLLSACSHPHVSTVTWSSHWEKDGAAASELAQTLTQCTTEAQVQARGDLGYREGCMEAHGFERVLSRSP